MPRMRSGGTPSDLPMSTLSVHDLIGKRMEIRAMEQSGSSRLLNGLKGTVIGLHPIAPGWVKFRLDRNTVTPHQEWSVPKERLIPCDDPDVPSARGGEYVTSLRNVDPRALASQNFRFPK